MRQVVLDTETTGLEPADGHRIIEIGCVELLDRKLTGRTYHQYINPARLIDDQAIEVHGITNEFLVDKPPFAAIVDDFLAFVEGAELVIHNAAFDVGFIDHEFTLCEKSFKPLTAYTSVLDTLKLARKMHPGQRNSLDALCKRYEIDNTHRELHGALLDAEILATVYLAMTGGQTTLSLGNNHAGASDSGAEPGQIRRLPADRPSVTVIFADAAEQRAHEAFLVQMEANTGQQPLWAHEPVEETASNESV